MGRVKGKVGCQNYVARFRYSFAIAWIAINLNFMR